MPNELHASFVIVRTPLLPIDAWLRWSDGLSALAAARSDADTAQQRELARTRLRTLVERTDVREALLAASPSLDDAVDVWLRAPESRRGEKVERALIRYLGRMCTRPTPFGMLAGCTLGDIGERPTLRLAPASRYRRRTQLDTRLVFETIAKQLSLPPARDKVPLVANRTLHFCGDRLRYVHVERAHRWLFSLVDVDASDAVRYIVARAAERPLRPALAETLACHVDVTLDDAAAFIDELIARQLLVPDLPLGLYGPRAWDAFVATAGPHHDPAIGRAIELAAALDRTAPGEGGALQRQLRATLREITPHEPAVHVDLFKPGRVTVPDHVVTTLTEAAQLLQRCGVRPPNRALERFKQRFMARYEGASVPLLQALDEDLGIGFDPLADKSAFDNELLDGLVRPERARAGTVLTRRDQHLLLRLHDSAWRPGRELVLGDDDVAALEDSDSAPLPASFGVLATLLAPSEEAVAAGRYRLLLSDLVDLSPLGMFARFADLDPRLADVIARHAQAEQALYPDRRLAEVVHVPDGHVANILWRPTLRDIAVPCGDGVSAADRQVQLGELLVSIEGDRVVLRAGKDGEEILPVMTTAHEAHSQRSLGLYRFLRALTTQDGSVAAWSWGALAGLPFLPRVRRGRVILSRARWRLDRRSLERIAGKRSCELMRAINEVRDELRLPRRVLAEDFDRELAIDLDNILSVESFAQWIGERRHVSLIEMLPDGDEHCVKGPEGSYAHELLVPLLRRAPPPTQARAVPPVRPRISAPGSEWLFAKLYTGQAHADAILLRVVKPLVEAARRAGTIDGWFVVRYADPEMHLRLRFHGVATRLHHELLPLLQAAAQPLLQSGECHRLQIDSYVPELRRYGGEQAMPLVERIFCADSDAALGLIELVAAGGESLRWRLALLSAHLLACDLGMPLTERAEQLRCTADAFARELALEAANRRALGLTFRRLRRELEDIVGDVVDGPVAAGRRLLLVRGEIIRDTATELRALAERGALTASFHDVAAALMHMALNRLLPAAPREQELAIAELLARIYESQLRRQ